MDTELSWACEIKDLPDSSDHCWQEALCYSRIRLFHEIDHSASSMVIHVDQILTFIETPIHTICYHLSCLFRGNDGQRNIVRRTRAEVNEVLASKLLWRSGRDVSILVGEI